MLDCRCYGQHLHENESRTEIRLEPFIRAVLVLDKTRLIFPRINGPNVIGHILGDPGADSGDAGKSKRAEKYGTKKSKERREEPLGTMSYQTSSKRSPPFWLLIGARKLFPPV